MSLNSLHVDLITRQWLRRAHLQDLGEAFVEDLEAVLTHHREHNLSGLVFDVAKLSDLRDHHCVALGSTAELLYCAFGLADDIQDGDVDDYLPGEVGQQLNVVFALRELGAIRMAESLADWRMKFASQQLSMTVLQMTVSQREELAAQAQGYREPWDVTAYERVALGAAGAEVSLLLLLVGLAIDASGAAGVCAVTMAHTLSTLGRSCGVLIQIRVDSASDDERLTSLSRGAIDKLWQRYVGYFNQQSRGLPSKLVARLAGATGAGDETCKSKSLETSTTTSKPSSKKGQ